MNWREWTRTLRAGGTLPPATVMAMGALACAALTPQAWGESLRCNGQSVSVGDSRLSVQHKCGAPALKDTVCATVYVPQTQQYLPGPAIGLPCIAQEDWLYERGPGTLSATVRFQNGVVQAIRYGQQAQ